MRIKLFPFSFSLCMAIAILGILSLPTDTQAQLTRGAVSGTVRDQTGAAIPEAQIRLTNPENNYGSETTSNSDGFYRLAPSSPEPTR